MNEQIKTLLPHFYEYAKSRLGFDKDASILFTSDQENSKNPLGATAHYNPDSMEVTVYISGRHPKDILRSVAHELVHHRQNCQGKMKDTGPTTPGYAQNDMHLRALEEEAYLEGNMCFRDWEDDYKANQEVGTIYEGKVVKVVDFGAFVNFLGAKDGLVHISELAPQRVGKVTDIVNEGDQVKVKVLAVDDRGKVKLSMKVVEQETGEEISGKPKEGPPSE